MPYRRTSACLRLGHDGIADVAAGEIVGPAYAIHKHAAILKRARDENCRALDHLTLLTGFECPSTYCRAALKFAPDPTTEEAETGLTIRSTIWELSLFPQEKQSATRIVSPKANGLRIGCLS